MTILCIDFGLKRIGFAVGSTETGIAFTRDILINDDQLFLNIKSIIDHDGVDEILVGSPRKRDGTAGDIEPQLQQFLIKMESVFQLPIKSIDERYSSKIASAKLSQYHITAKKQKLTLDSVAAQHMLQEWLDQQVK